MLHEPKFWTIIFFLGELLAGGVAALVENRRKIGLAAMGMATLGLLCIFFFWPEAEPHPTKAGISINQEGATTNSPNVVGNRNTVNINPESPPSRAVVLVSDCRMDVLPIMVPPHLVFNVLPLRSKPANPPVIFGIAVLFSIDNTAGDKPVKWPPANIQPKRKSKAPIWIPEWSWRCEVKNMGETAITDATLTFIAHFGENPMNNGREPQQLPVRIGALNAGDTFTLWIVNESDELAVVDRPRTITVQVPGESERRPVPLTQGGSGLTDILPVFVFVPTRNKWPQ